jgi:hypothetical protein
MTIKRFTNDELVQLIAELPMDTPQRSAYAQMLAERKVWEMAAPDLRELCSTAGPRRADDKTLDWICSQLGSDNWGDDPGWFEDFGPPSRSA